MAQPRGSVYWMNRMGPRTDPCGTPQVRNLDPPGDTYSALEVGMESTQSRSRQSIGNPETLQEDGVVDSIQHWTQVQEDRRRPVGNLTETF
jgi:hypothetical protein